MMKGWVLLTVLSCLLLVCPIKSNGEELQELSSNRLLLLNVAVKARIVERLTDAVTSIETLRERMVEFIKSCLIDVSATEGVCKSCVKDACQRRAIECKTNISKMETVAEDTETISIPGVQFLKNPKPLEEGLEIMTENAHEEILDNVPSDLKSKGEELMHKADDKLRVLQQKLQHSVQELPGLVPRVTGAIQSISTDFDPDALMNLADKTVGTISKAFNEKDNIAGTIDIVVGQLPDLITQMNDKMVKMTAAMGTFVSRASSRFSNYISDGAESPDEIPPPSENTWRQGQPQVLPGQQLTSERLQMQTEQNIPGQQLPQRQQILPISGQQLPQGQQIPPVRSQQLPQGQQIPPASGQQLPQGQQIPPASGQRFPQGQQIPSVSGQQLPQGQQQISPEQREHWEKVKQQLPQVVSNVWGAVRKNVPRLLNDMWSNVRQHIPPNWTRQPTPQSAGSAAQRSDHWTVKRINLSGDGHVGSGFIISHSSRFRRETPVSCHDLAVNPVTACHAYHFKCPACLNETVILKQECGPDAMKMMVAIKKIDLKAADYVMTYTKHVKNGFIVKKVEYDPHSFDKSSGTYKTAYVTAKVRNEIVRYHTTLLPNLEDLETSGGEIGDEIWMILDDDDSNTDVSNRLGKATHSQKLQHSSAAVNTVVWGMMGFVMYLGFIVL